MHRTMQCAGAGCIIVNTPSVTTYTYVQENSYVWWFHKCGENCTNPQRRLQDLTSRNHFIVEIWVKIQSEIQAEIGAEIGVEITIESAVAVVRENR